MMHPMHAVGQPIPGAPTFIPVEPKASQIVLGMGIAAIAIWSMASWLPDHRPMNQAEQVAYVARCAARGENCVGHHMLSAQVYPWAFVIAGLLGLAGLEQIIRGATYRALREVTCGTCKRKVIGRKTFIGIQCPVGPHLAEQHIGKFVLLVLLAIVLIAMAGR